MSEPSSSTIGFTKYTKFDNHYRTKYVESIKSKNDEMNQLLEKHGESLEWYCSEKIHGCNLSFIVDKLENDRYRMEVANRSTILSQSSVSFYPKTIEELSQKFTSKSIKLFERIKESLPEWFKKDVTKELNEQDHSPQSLKTVQIFGELFGGSFPKKQPSDYKAIQSGICYCPHHDFYAFDVLMTFENGKQVWALFGLVDPLLEECEFVVRSRPLFRGTLDECLQFDVKFNSTLPGLYYSDIVNERKVSWKDLENIVEGVVIKPVNYNIFVESERAVIKKKNEKFLETAESTTETKTKQPASKQDSEELEQTWSELSRYITSNRLSNVLSKIGTLSKSNMYMVMKELSKDAIEEFKLDLERGGIESNCKNVESLSGEDQKKITKKISDVCMLLIREQLNNNSVDQ